MKIYNGEGMILGRLAAVAAKETLLGEEVRIINCERVIISGDKEQVFARELQRRQRKGNPLRSSTYSRLPDRFVRRTIRGMLPWKTARGREAFARVLCYRGVPSELPTPQLITLEKASVRKLPSLKYTTVGAVCNALRGLDTKKNK